LYIILCFTLTDFDTRIGRLRIMKQKNARITPCVLLWKTIQWNCTSLVSFIPNTAVVRTSTGSLLCSTVNLLYARPTNICSGLLHNQGTEHMPWMHCSLKAYCATLITPPYVLDVPTFAPRCLHIHMM